MDNGHAYDARFDRRVRDVGHEIFELAADASPKAWHKARWLEGMTRWVAADERLKTAAFEFVACLPSLTDGDDIVRHLAEYAEVHRVPLPPIARWALAPRDRGSAVAALIGRAAWIGAFAMADRFITGHDVASIVRTLERFRRHRMAFTLDVLGESTTSAAAADRYAHVYHDLMKDLCPRARDWADVPIIDQTDRGPQPRVNLSLKLTGLDPHFDAIDPRRSMDAAGARLRPLLRRARELGAFVNIDMESSAVRELTLDFFESLMMEDEFRDWTDVGIVVQAYLTDGEGDLQRLLEWGRRRGRRFAVRLVKGAYWDAEVAAALRAGRTPPVWMKKWQSDACYERMARVMLRHTGLIRPCFASHNVRSLAFVLATAESLGLPPTAYEVQMLYGMGDPLKTAMTQLGCCVRVYSPYGDLIPGMAYLIRRLLENTSNDSFLKQGFRDRGKHDSLLADPAIARPPCDPPPDPHEKDDDGQESAFVNPSYLTDWSRGENRAAMQAALADVHAAAGREIPALIQGKPAAIRSRFDSTNPSNPREVMARVADAASADVDSTVAALRRAHPAALATSAAQRADLIRAVAEAVTRSRWRLAATLVLEAGKPWRQADAEVGESIELCRSAAEELRDQGTKGPRDPGTEGPLSTQHSPLSTSAGVRAALGSWNAPLSSLVAAAVRSLADGRALLMIPHRLTPVIGHELVRAMIDAGAAVAALAYVPTHDPAVAARAAAHPDVTGLCYYGPPDAFVEGALNAATERNGGGGFALDVRVCRHAVSVIVDHDADSDAAIAGCVAWSLSFSGQRCVSAHHVVVAAPVFDVFCERLAAAVAGVVVGPAEEPSTLVGPLIDEESCRRAAAREDVARRQPATQPGGSGNPIKGGILVKRVIPEPGPGGHYFAPCVIQVRDGDAPLPADAILGPVIVVAAAADFADALSIAGAAGAAPLGGLYSRSPANVAEARRRRIAERLVVNPKNTGFLKEISIHAPAPAEGDRPQRTGTSGSPVVAQVKLHPSTPPPPQPRSIALAG